MTAESGSIFQDKRLWIGFGGIIIVAVLIVFIFMKNNDGNILIPYISHQKPVIDPHVPSSNDLADKLDEALFDGLFNIAAKPSGVTYEDGLGTLLRFENNVAVIKLNTERIWHNSYKRWLDGDEIKIEEESKHYFSAKDLKFTLSRIQRLGSLSPDYVLVYQAIDDFSFTGPDENNQIQFTFNDTRIWSHADIKEVLSFKILPETAGFNDPEYKNGSGPYTFIGENEAVQYFFKHKNSNAEVPNLQLVPFIDNSTYVSELSSNTINLLLSTPYGAVPSILEKDDDFFSKSNLSTSFFAIYFNTERLGKEKRKFYRSVLDANKIINSFYKVGTEQQRHIIDFKNNKDNYEDYVNFSAFPRSSYYVEEKIIRKIQQTEYDLNEYQDTLDLKVSLNHGFKEELSEISNVLNDKSLFGAKIKVTAVNGDVIKSGDYDAVLVPVTGYRSNFLYDLYNIFLKVPDLNTHEISLKSRAGGIDKSSWNGSNNFFRLNANDDSEAAKLLTYIYEFMASKEIGDKQQYAIFIDELEQEMALGAWLFSLPSLSYFSKQFDEKSIYMYGTASQLSTIEQWKEQKE